MIMLDTRVKRLRKSKAEIDTGKRKKMNNILVKLIGLKVLFPNPLYLCYLNFTFTCITFVEFRFTISCALYARAQRDDILCTTHLCYIGWHWVSFLSLQM